MLVVHHLNNSRSHRVLWLLEELGLPYEIKHYQRDADLRAPPELRAVHPLGKSPVVTDGTHVFAESGAILESLIALYGEGRLAPPRGSEEWLRYLYWMHYAEGSAMPPLLIKLIFDIMPDRAPFLLRPLLRKISQTANASYAGPEIARHVAFWESTLATRAWFAGDDFTAADIQMSYPVGAAMVRAMPTQQPNIRRWRAAIAARPAYARAIEKGGPAFPEA